MSEPGIRTIDENGTFEEVVSGASPEIRALAYALRELLAEIVPGITEVPWARQRTVGYGIGPRKMSDHFCYLAPHRQHVNLGFLYGAELPDPEGVLEGSGKSMRHVKIRSHQDLERPSVRRLTEAAYAHLTRETR